MQTSWNFKGLKFRFLVEEDFDNILEFLQDEDVGEFLWFTPIDELGMRSYFEPLLENQNIILARGKTPRSPVFSVFKDDEFIGDAGIEQLDGAPDNYNIGYQLKKSAWGKGYGTTACEFLIHFAKEHLKAHKLFADCMSGNIGSAKVLTKNGFTFEGTLKERYFKNGKYFDNDFYGLKI